MVFGLRRHEGGPSSWPPLAGRQSSKLTAFSSTRDNRCTYRAMGIAERRATYAKLQEARQSHILAIYLVSRPGLQSQMASDLFPPLFEVIGKLPADDKPVDILIDSLGGQADVAIRINDVLRELKRKVNVLVPRNAFSAATMLALGGAKIVMHPLACLGPIDPQLMVRRNDGNIELIGAEDIKAFVEFIRDEVGITDQKEVAQMFARMYDEVKPVQLGVARRASKRSVAIAKELLERHRSDGTKIDSISDRLAGGYHAHGHPISPKAALDLGLDIDVATGENAKLLWALVEDADQALQAGTPLNPQALLLEAWDKRLADWRAALATHHGPPPGVGGPGSVPPMGMMGGAPQIPSAVLAEVQAMELSMKTPIKFEVDATMGLVEGTQGAFECNAKLQYIGSVTPQGVQVSPCAPVILWKRID